MDYHFAHYVSCVYDVVYTGLPYTETLYGRHRAFFIALWSRSSLKFAVATSNMDPIAHALEPSPWIRYLVTAWTR